MKISIILLAVFVLASLGFAQDAKPAQAPASADLSVATIAVPTIQCGMCVKSITKAVTALDGVTSAEVSLDEKTTTVTFDSKKTDLQKIEQSIADIGYNANETKRDPKAYEKLSPCCKMDE